MTPLQLAFATIWLATCGYAAVRGGPPERLAASLIVIAAVASARLQTGQGGAFHGFEPGIMAVDTAMFVILVTLSLVTTRFWPVAMSSLQGATVLSHLAQLLDKNTFPAGYFVMAVMWSFPILSLLGIATWRHQLRRQAYGLDHSWVHQLPATYRTQASVHARP